MKDGLNQDLVTQGLPSVIGAGQGCGSSQGGDACFLNDPRNPAGAIQSGNLTNTNKEET